MAGNVSRGLLMRGVGGSRSSWVAPFTLGDVAKTYTLPFDFEQAAVAKTYVHQFRLDGPAGAAPEGSTLLGYRLPFSLLGPASASVSLPFAMLNATVGADAAGIIAPEFGWRDPTPDRALSYMEAVRSTPDVLGYWRAAETSGTTAADTLGITNGTYNASATKGRPSLVKDAADRAVAMYTANAIGLSFTAGSWLDVTQYSGYTIECWCIFSTAGTTSNTLLFGDAGNFLLRYDGSASKKFGFYVSLGGVTTPGIASTTAVTTGVRYHVAATFVASTKVLRLYVNGAEDATAVDRSGAGAQAAGTAYGIGLRGGTDVGDVDEIALYGRALTGAEIADHWARGA